MPATYRKHWLVRTCLISPEIFERLIRSAIMFLVICVYFFIYVTTGWPWRQLWYYYPCLESRGYWVSCKLTLTQLSCPTPLFFLTASRLKEVYNFKLWFPFYLLSSQFISCNNSPCKINNGATLTIVLHALKLWFLFVPLRMFVSFLYREFIFSWLT